MREHGCPSDSPPLSPSLAGVGNPARSLLDRVPEKSRCIFKSSAGCCHPPDSPVNTTPDPIDWALFGVVGKELEVLPCEEIRMQRCTHFFSDRSVVKRDEWLHLF
jgi:hypothetical protein